MRDRTCRSRRRQRGGFLGLLTARTFDHRIDVGGCDCEHAVFAADNDIA